jgi:hypothetical protein
VQAVPIMRLHACHLLGNAKTAAKANKFMKIRRIYRRQTYAFLPYIDKHRRKVCRSICADIGCLRCSRAQSSLACDFS